MKAVILIFLVLASVAWFARNAARLFKLVAQGRPENRMGDWGRRLGAVAVHVFGHRRMLDRKAIGLSRLQVRL